MNATYLVTVISDDSQKDEELEAMLMIGLQAMKQSGADVRVGKVTDFEVRQRIVAAIENKNEGSDQNKEGAV